jgi:hypothetical protein
MERCAPRFEGPSAVVLRSALLRAAKDAATLLTITGE